MPRTDFSQMECSIARTLDVIGERWALLIVRDAFYGVRRFDDFQRGLGVARNVLTDRLNQLVAHGVFDRRRYQERPERYEYRLTPKGRDLLPVVLAMMRWGYRWANDDAAIPPLTVTHLTCGHDTTPVVACSECGGELRLGEIVTDPIPFGPQANVPREVAV